jgi:hypothetical protein
MSKIPKEALQFAKKMGLDLSGLEPEAEEIWQKLNSMAETNEKEYVEFVAQSIQEGKDSGAAGGDTASRKRTFRPDSSFSMQGITSGGDGIKIREGNKGKTLYVNFCGHKVVQIPELHGRRIEDMATADGLEIPLLLGELRHISIGTVDCICLDAVLNLDVALQVYYNLL